MGRARYEPQAVISNLPQQILGIFPRSGDDDLSKDM
jgi:hypothetical protein